VGRQHLSPLKAALAGDLYSGSQLDERWARNPVSLRNRVSLSLIKDEKRYKLILNYIAVLNDLRNRDRAHNPGFFKKPGF
jgi:hypothetical protein